MATAEKEQAVAALEELVAQSTSIYLADFKGMNVDQATKMRRKFREAKVKYIVAKNTLAKRALRARGVEALDPYLEGPTGFAFGEDEIAAAKILSECVKEFQRPELKAAWVGGHLYDAEGIKSLALLPPREALLGQFIGTLNAPMQGLVGVLSGSLRQMVGVIDAIGKKKQG